MFRNDLTNMKFTTTLVLIITAFGVCASWADGGTYPGYSPVPEPSTIVAGTLCLVPLGVAAFRAWRKSR